MTTSMSGQHLTTWQLKISGIIISLSIALSILIFGGRISEFAPKHNLVFFETAQIGTIPDYQLTEFTPGFYTFGSILVQITGFSEYQSLFAPVLLIPVTTLLLALLYRFSGSLILSSFLVAGYLLFGSDGTDRLFLGLHGTGWILLFATILSILLLLLDDDHRQRSFGMLLIFSVSVAFISYNRSAEILLLFAWISIIFVGLGIIRKRVWPADFSPQRASLSLLLAIVITVAVHSFFNTFLNRFIPWSVWAITESGYSGLGRILSLRFNVDTDVPLQDLSVHTPAELTALGTARYLLIGILLLIFLGIVFIRVFKKQATILELIVTAFIFGQGSFALIRAAVGNLNVTYAFLPALLTIAVLYRLTSEISTRRIQSSFKALSIGVAIFLLITSLLYVGLAINQNMVNNSSTSFETSEPASTWHANHIDSEMRSDEYTANLVRIHEYDNPKLDPMADIQQARTTEIQTAVGRETVVSDRYFVLNHQLNYLVFAGWKRLMPWGETIAERESNTNLSRIYDQGNIVTYKYDSEKN